MDDAAFYLNKSHELNPGDAQVLYKLAGAYSQKKDYETALATINKCLRINSNYPQANNLKQQLTQSIYNKSKK